MPKSKHTRTFTCETCGSVEIGDMRALHTHLSEKHGIVGRIAGTREVVMCLDGDEYRNVYKCSFNAPNLAVVEVTEVASGPKEG